MNRDKVVVGLMASIVSVMELKTPHDFLMLGFCLGLGAKTQRGNGQLLGAAVLHGFAAGLIHETPNLDDFDPEQALSDILAKTRGKTDGNTPKG